MENQLSRDVRFSLHGMLFEYDEKKNLINIEKHGISFKNAALVFLDYNRVELYDDQHSDLEDRYQTIGNAHMDDRNSVGIGSPNKGAILFVVYTERSAFTENGQQVEITRIISARQATAFERGIYYGKYN